MEIDEVVSGLMHMSTCGSNLAIGYSNWQHSAPPEVRAEFHLEPGPTADTLARRVLEALDHTCRLADELADLLTTQSQCRHLNDDDTLDGGRCADCGLVIELIG